MNLIEKIRKHGFVGSARIAAGMTTRRLRPRIDAWRFRNAPKYANPTESELMQIESDLADLSIAVADYAPPRSIQTISTGSLVPQGLPRRPNLRRLG